MALEEPAVMVPGPSHVPWGVSARVSVPALVRKLTVTVSRLVTLVVFSLTTRSSCSSPPVPSATAGVGTDSTSADGSDGLEQTPLLGQNCRAGVAKAAAVLPSAAR